MTSLTLRSYQKEGIVALIQKSRFLLRDDPGLGKTIQLICAINVLARANPKTTHVLVVCPKSMVITWEREIEKWSTEDINWTVINHDKFISKGAEKYLKKWDLVIGDESHQYLKNINTKRARFFFALSDLSSTVWLSTATVASKSGEDYYATFKLLLPELFSKVSRSAFIARFCKKIPDRWCTLFWLCTQ